MNNQLELDKYAGHTEGPWYITTWLKGDPNEGGVIPASNMYLFNDAPLLLAEVKRLREENDLLRSMQRDGIEASAHDNLLSEINRLREDNEKLHDAINRSFHAKISGSALEIYNGWWEGEEE